MSNNNNWSGGYDWGQWDVSSSFKQDASIYKDADLPFETISALPTESVIKLDSVDRRLGALIDIPVSPTLGYLYEGAQKGDEYMREYMRGDQRWAEDEANVAQHDLLGDMFWELYKFYNPEVKSKDEVSDERMVNQWLINKLKSHDKFEQIRDSTVGKIPAAVSGLQPLASWLHKEYEEELKKQEEMRKAKERGDQRRAEELRQQLEAMMRRKDGMPDGAMEQAIGDAQEAAQDTSGMMDAFGMRAGSQDGIKQQIKMFAAANQNIRKIAALLGRLRGGFGKSSREATEGNGFILNGMRASSIDLVPNLMPETFAKINIGNPYLQARTVAEVIDGEALAWRYGVAKKDGDLVICVDGSGSMQGAPHLAAAAFALALMLDARDQDRQAHWCAFGNKVTHEYTLDINDEPTKIVEEVSHADFGGTAFDPPLRWAYKKLQDNKNADLIFITDGQSHVSDPVQQQLKELVDAGTNVYVLYISEYGEAYADQIQNPTLNSFATNVAVWTNPEDYDQIDSVYRQFQQAITSAQRNSSSIGAGSTDA